MGKLAIQPARFQATSTPCIVERAHNSSGAGSPDPDRTLAQTGIWFTFFTMLTARGDSETHVELLHDVVSRSEIVHGESVFFQRATKAGKGNRPGS